MDALDELADSVLDLVGEQARRASVSPGDAADRMTALERIRARLEREYADCVALRDRNAERLTQLEEELTTIARSLDWLRGQP